MTAPFTVSITGVAAVEVYGGLAALQDYLGAAVGDGAAAFRALASTPDDQKRLLVDATRYIDRQGWAGTPTFLLPVAPSNPTTLQWPRSGVTNPDASVLDSTTVPAAILKACFEMVAILAADGSAKDAADTSSNIQSMGAGTAKLAFFRPTSLADGNATVMPSVLMQLVGQWLGSAALAPAVMGMSSGTTGCSQFGSGGDCCSICDCSPCCCVTFKRSGPF